MDGKQLLVGFRSVNRSLCHHLVERDLSPSVRDLEVHHFPESALFSHSGKRVWKVAFLWMEDGGVETGCLRSQAHTSDVTRLLCRCLCGVAHTCAGCATGGWCAFPRVEGHWHCPLLSPASSWRRTCSFSSWTSCGRSQAAMCAFSCCRPWTSSLRTSVTRPHFVRTVLTLASTLLGVAARRVPWFLCCFVNVCAHHVSWYAWAARAHAPGWVA